MVDTFAERLQRERKWSCTSILRDDTETCTLKEACNLRDNFSGIKSKGIVVLGVSLDNEKSHKKFEKKYSLPFTYACRY